MKKVICVGNAVVDIIVKNGLERTPDGMTKFSDGIDMFVGGDAVNEAISLSAMGNDVRLYTLVGEDYLGDIFTNIIDKAGINTCGVVRDRDHATTVTIATVDATGEHNCMTLKDGAAANMRYSTDLFSIDFTGAKMVSIASLFWSKKQKDEELVELLRQAKAAGAVTIADMVLDQSHMTLGDISGALKYFDYVAPGYYEAAYFTGQNTPEKVAANLHQRGVRNVILKMGANGVFASSAGKNYYVPTLATKVVDTLGAGDNFVAGFITAIVDGRSIEEALYFGSASSAIAISQYGANGAIKSKKQVQDYLDKHRDKPIFKT